MGSEQVSGFGLKPLSGMFRNKYLTFSILVFTVEDRSNALCFP